MDKQIKEIISHVSAMLGKDLSVYDQNFLGSMIGKRLESLELSDMAEYRDYLRKNSGEVAKLSGSLNISFSTFFREPPVFTLLEQQILPYMIGRKPVGSEFRIWSAGCSAGQEAYTMAMLMEELIGSERQDLRYRIFATDISQSQLSAARDGIYDSQNLQNVTLKHVNRYFVHSNAMYAVIPRLKNHITFSYYDMLDRSSVNPPESIYGNFDIVLCSNLLMYYQPGIRDFMVKKLMKSLSETGYLVTGEAERAIIDRASGLRPFNTTVSIYKNV